MVSVFIVFALAAANIAQKLYNLYLNIVYFIKF